MYAYTHTSFEGLIRAHLRQAEPMPACLQSTVDFDFGPLISHTPLFLQPELDNSCFWNQLSSKREINLQNLLKANVLQFSLLRHGIHNQSSK